MTKYYCCVFSAPEVQHKSCFSSSSDMYSLGMVYIASFNSGQSVILVYSGTCTVYSLGMVYCTVYIASFNSGHSVIQVYSGTCTCTAWAMGMVYQSINFFLL